MMKNMLYAFTIVALIVFNSPFCWAVVREITGFRNIKFGDSIERVKILHPETKLCSGRLLYTFDEEYMVELNGVPNVIDVAGFEVSSLLMVSTQHNKVAAISLIFFTEENKVGKRFSDLKKTLVERYGNPWRVVTPENNIIWIVGTSAAVLHPPANDSGMCIFTMAGGTEFIKSDSNVANSGW